MTDDPAVPAGDVPALCTPLVLPELSLARSPRREKEEPVGNGSVRPSGRYFAQPNASPAAQLAEAIIERLPQLREDARTNGTPEPALSDASWADLPPGSRLPLALKEVLRGTPPNLYLHVGGVDQENAALAEGLAGARSDGEALGGEDLAARPAFVAYVSCQTAWWLRLGALRERIQQRASAEVARAALNAITEALDPLMPVWDVACAMEYIRELHWHGYCDDSERLFDVKHDLAHSRECDPEDISDEEAREVSEGYLWSTPFVHSVLPETFRERHPEGIPGPASLKAHLSEAGLSSALGLVREAETVREQTKALEGDFGFAPQRAGALSRERRTPWSLIATIEDEGEGTDSVADPGNHLVVETFEEEAQHAMEAGFEEAPMNGVVFDPTTERGRGRFFTYLERMKACVLSAQALIEKASPRCYAREAAEANHEQTMREALEERRRVAENSAPIPPAFLSEEHAGQLRRGPVEAGSVLSALRGRGSAERPLPSGVVPLMAG